MAWGDTWDPRRQLAVWGYPYPEPSFAQTWFGGEYPARVRRQALSGWQCPGCDRCFSPEVLQCRFCGPDGQPESGVRGCGEP